MKKIASLSITLSMAAVLLAGCASSGGSPDMAENPTAPNVSATNYLHTIAPGDRLSDIALRYTGQSSNWRAIATYNNIVDPRTLRIGDTIIIPASMIPASNQTTANSATSTTSKQAASLGTGRPGLTNAASGTLALQRAQEPAASATDVVVEPVATNRTFQLKPMDSSTLDPIPYSQIAPPQVRVIGTYYPKGVYQQPTSYSTLMMRVAPGTVFELEREVNDWYKIVTNKGVGYLRMIDGKVFLDE